MNTTAVWALAVSCFLMCQAMSPIAAAQPGAGAASGGSVTPSVPSGQTTPATTPAPARILEVAVNTVVTATEADALDKATAASIEQQNAAITRPGCTSSNVAAIPAAPRAGGGPPTPPAAVVRATVWDSIENAEAAALAADTGGAAPTSGSSFFRLLRDAKISDGTPGHLEVVVFRTKPGVTREANLALFDKGEADYAELGAGDGGLLGHSLWIAPDGRWVHLLYWRSEADYVKTGKALFARPGVGGWIRSLDFKRFTVYRGDIARPGKPSAAPTAEPATTK